MDEKAFPSFTFLRFGYFTNWINACQHKGSGSQKRQKEEIYKSSCVLTGVATIISAPSWHALVCSHMLPPPYAHTTLMLYTFPNFLASWYICKRNLTHVNTLLKIEKKNLLGGGGGGTSMIRCLGLKVGLSKQINIQQLHYILTTGTSKCCNSYFIR